MSEKESEKNGNAQEVQQVEHWLAKHFEISNQSHNLIFSVYLEIISKCNESHKVL
jgi:hypothetical protein